MRKTSPVRIGKKGAKLMKVRLSWVQRTRRPPMMRPKIPVEKKDVNYIKARKGLIFPSTIEIVEVEILYLYLPMI